MRAGSFVRASKMDHKQHQTHPATPDPWPPQRPQQACGSPRPPSLRAVEFAEQPPHTCACCFARCGCFGNRSTAVEDSLPESEISDVRSSRQCNETPLAGCVCSGCLGGRLKQPNVFCSSHSKCCVGCELAGGDRQQAPPDKDLFFCRRSPSAALPFVSRERRRAVGRAPPPTPQRTTCTRRKGI